MFLSSLHQSLYQQKRNPSSTILESIQLALSLFPSLPTHVQQVTLTEYLKITKLAIIKAGMTVTPQELGLDSYPLDSEPIFKDDWIGSLMVRITELNYS